MLLAKDWEDYELLDAGNGEKLERWGSYRLRRPDPQAIWPVTCDRALWEQADARYIRSSSGGGQWSFRNRIPGQWTLSYRDLKFVIHPTGFKHTGLFPEQAVNWDWMMERIRDCQRPVRVLNLFAYTGGATVACASRGAEVCHVDAAKGMVAVAGENLRLSGLEDRRVRLIVDDVLKFVQREERRQSRYDAVIMDPPSYGRGPGGEVWKMEDRIYDFVEACMRVLSKQPLFFLVNSYTTGLSPLVMENIFRLTLGRKYPHGRITAGETGIPATLAPIILPCGAYCRWEA